jgi:hypothetical protein
LQTERGKRKFQIDRPAKRINPGGPYLRQHEGGGPLRFCSGHASRSLRLAGDRRHKRLGDQASLVSLYVGSAAIKPAIDPQHREEAGRRILDTASERSASDTKADRLSVGEGN